MLQIGCHDQRPVQQRLLCLGLVDLVADPVLVGRGGSIQHPSNRRALGGTSPQLVPASTPTENSRPWWTSVQELTMEHPVSDNPKGYINPHLLITPEALSERLADGSEPPVLLDLRPAEAFAAGHIPGAVHLDLYGVSLVDTDPAPLAAFLWMIGHLLASRGVDPQRTVVVYDETSGMRAARAFWFLEYFEHPDARQLDGGFGAWQREGRPLARPQKDGATCQRLGAADRCGRSRSRLRHSDNGG